MTTALIAAAGCATAPTATRSVGFAVGEAYRTLAPVCLIEHGRLATLSPCAEDERARPYLAAGVRLEVVRIREENTLTYDRNRWPEGVIRTGPHTGDAVSLGHPELPGLLGRVE